jgi:hypothetical protein
VAKDIALGSGTSPCCRPRSTAASSHRVSWSHGVDATIDSLSPSPSYSTRSTLAMIRQ